LREEGSKPITEVTAVEKRRRVSGPTARALYLARRYDEAIEQLRRTVDLGPNYPVTYWILGLVLRKTGCYERAIIEGEKGVKLSGGSPLMRAALAHTLSARLVEKRKHYKCSMI
jgi:tetratricopeptide (TPR) repeat protein